ncbi:MAG: hypothetical protein PHI88_03480 [Candidatus Pacebacteria bacterium]|jgi:hypothetical protein|nr:hypothetical protein [Candidatus Paceibacterota bacterium]
MENKNPLSSSIFGFYFVINLLGVMGWPKRRNLLNSEAIINSLVLDLAIKQMIDWSASIGACRPNLALQMISTMFRENKDSLNLLTVVNDLKRIWNERGNNNPEDVIQPIKFCKVKDISNSEKFKNKNPEFFLSQYYKDVISVQDLKNKDTVFLLERYCFESLIWGLVNPDNFRDYYEREEKSHKNFLPMMQEAGVEIISSFLTLEQFLKDGEEILKKYEQEVRPLSSIFEELMNNALSLGIKVNS